MNAGPLFPYRGARPRLAAGVFVAPTSSIVGDVEIGVESSVWYGAVIRGDVQPIRIGTRTSIQDNTVIHATRNWQATRIGDRVTVGHSVVLHGCTIADDVLVGMGAIVLDAAEVGEWVVLGAGSLVTARTRIPPGVLAMGQPAKPIRELRESEIEMIRSSAAAYVEYAAEHRVSLSDDEPD